MMQIAPAWLWRCLTLACLAATFTLDYFTPPGFGIGTLYVLIVLLAWMAQNAAFIQAVALTSAGLTILGVYLGAPDLGSVSDSLIWSNRMSALIVIAATALFATEQLRRYRESQENSALLARTKSALEENQRLLQVASETGSIGGWEAHLPEFRIRWSDELARIHGKPPGFSPSLQEGLDFYTPECRDRIAEAFGACARDGTPFSEELQLIAPDGGAPRWVRTAGSATFGADGAVLRVQGALQDISNVKTAELKLAKLSRVHAMLNEINTAIMHIKDRQVLFDTACRIAVESCGFRAAWIGMVDEASLRVQPAATAGDMAGYLESISITSLPVEPGGRGPFITAIEQNRAAICNDTRTDPAFQAWRDAALAHGFRSLAVFPMRLALSDRSAFVLYSGVADFFDAEEVKLLANLTANIAFASALIVKEEERSRSGRVLEESEDRFRAVFNQAAAGICLMSGDYRFLRVNQQFCSILGYSADELTGAAFRDTTHPDDREGDARAIVQLLAGADDVMLEKRYVRKDGAIVWVQLSLSLLQDRSDQTRFVGVISDISEQKIAREKILRQQSRLTSTLEGITDAFFTVSPDWRFTYLNGEAEHLMQRSRDDLIGKDLWDEFPEILNTVFEHQYRRAMQEKTSGSFEYFHESQNLWLEVHLYPSVEGLAIYLRDVSRRHASNDQLRLLESAIARLNDIVIITEAEPISATGPHIVFVNEAFERRTGYLREEVLGRSPQFLQGPKTQRAELDRIRQAIEEWKPVRAELLNYSKSGEEYWIELDIVPIADEKGRYTHWVSVERDVTERRKLQEQLHRSQQLESIGQLTGGLAHDFNNLLTIIMGNAELLSERLADPRHNPLAQMILEAAERGADLTHSLLAFARRQPLDPELTDINRLIAGMDGLLRRSLGEHIHIQLIAGAGLWNTLVDPAQLESALLNLCINSRDAMPGGGTLTVETANIWLDQEQAAQHGDVQPGEASPGPYVMLAVSDSGSGIAQEHIGQVFEPFFTTKETGKGTGLGLSMVYGFVKQSRGHISISSEPGHGTTVKMYLARAPEDARRIEERTESPLLSGSEMILLVEDDPQVRHYAIGQLTELGYRVSEADNGLAALEIISARDDIDLLFTDVVMPGAMNGRKLADAARSLRPDLKVLYTSGYTDNAIVHHGRLDPGVHLLTKPYRRADLARMVRIAIDTDPQGLAQ